MIRLRRSLPLFTVVSAVLVLYLYHLNGVGMLLPDEPRYTAIGRAMAQTGDWITPRLWGSPWFEKPPFYYWMAALGTWSGLDADLCGRLPTALLSLAFLVFYYLRLRHEFQEEAAATATILLATSAGWLAYSGLGLTDLPLAVFFSSAVLVSMPLIENRGPVKLLIAAAGIFLGFATLAKGLVPLALAAPFSWFLRKHWRDWWIGAACFLVIAAPWYTLVYQRNGFPFVEEFLIKHHLQRLYSESLQHVQPWYFYLPVLILAMFPWSPLLFVLFNRKAAWDGRSQFLLAIASFGLLFFTISLNKLPGYLLPVMPSVFALVGSRIRVSRGWLLASAACISLIPVVARILPVALNGSRVSISTLALVNRVDLFFAALPIAVALLARRSWAGMLLALCVVGGALYMKFTVYPVLDQEVSARGLWRTVSANQSRLCDAGLHRNWQYGLAFYRGSPLPVCLGKPGEIRLSQQGNRVPSILAPH